MVLLVQRAQLDLPVLLDPLGLRVLPRLSRDPKAHKGFKVCKGQLAQ
jgi:hypothetical protein